MRLLDPGQTCRACGQGMCDSGLDVRLRGLVGREDPGKTRKDQDDRISTLYGREQGPPSLEGHKYRALAGPDRS